MVRTLIGEGVPNITQPSTEYPFGKFKDKTSAGTNDGTELSERVLGDMYQGMLNTIIRTGATPNNQPETALISQFADAVELMKPIGVALVGSDDGSTFTVLASKVRDPDITFGTGYVANQSDVGYLSANFHIKRKGVLDTTHRYIVTASQAFDSATPSILVIAMAPHAILSHGPYFNNTNIFLSDLSNLVFMYPSGITVAPETAVRLARAVLTVYDAGPVV